MKVKSTFVVVVHDPNGDPLPGMNVTADELIRKSGTSASHVEVAAMGITGRDGKAVIGLAQDDYTVGATVNGVSSQVVRIQVYDDGTGASEITLTWPGGPITEIQNVSGFLGLGASKDAWVGAEVALKDAVSEKSIGDMVTDSKGRFAFPKVTPGFYALHVRNKIPNPPRLPQLEGDIPIHVTDGAQNYELPTWGFAASSCGLSAYKDAKSMIILSP